MRIALVGLEADTAEQLAAWLGDEGHLPRRFDSIASFTFSDEASMVAVAFCTVDDLATVGEVTEVDCRLVVIGEEGTAADAHLVAPLRRREVLAALAAS